MTPLTAALFCAHRPPPPPSLSQVFIKKFFVMQTLPLVAPLDALILFAKASLLACGLCAMEVLAYERGHVPKGLQSRAATRPTLAWQLFETRWRSARARVELALLLSLCCTTVVLWAFSNPRTASVAGSIFSGVLMREGGTAFWSTPGSLPMADGRARRALSILSMVAAWTCILASAFVSDPAHDPPDEMACLHVVLAFLGCEAIAMVIWRAPVVWPFCLPFDVTPQMREDAMQSARFGWHAWTCVGGAVSVVSAYMIIASRQMTGTPMEAVAVVQTAWIVHAVAAGLESVLIIIGRERAIRRMATLTTPKVSFAEPT